MVPHCAEPVRTAPCPTAPSRSEPHSTARAEPSKPCRAKQAVPYRAEQAVPCCAEHAEPSRASRRAELRKPYRGWRDEPSRTALAEQAAPGGPSAALGRAAQAEPDLAAPHCIRPCRTDPPGPVRWTAPRRTDGAWPNSRAVLDRQGRGHIGLNHTARPCRAGLRLCASARPHRLGGSGLGGWGRVSPGWAYLSTAHRGAEADRTGTDGRSSAGLDGSHRTSGAAPGKYLGRAMLGQAQQGLRPRRRRRRPGPRLRAG